MIVKTKGIVIRSRDLRETSKLTTFFTFAHGKVTGVLKGIRKDHKKFGSSVDRFSVNDIVFYQYKRSDIHLVSQCDLTQYFFPIRQNYERNVAANYALELVDAVMPVEEPNPHVYQALLAYLEALQTTTDIERLVFIFQIKILHLSGFSPHLDSCVRCNAAIKGRAKFSMSMGGLLCADCPAGETSFTQISRGTVSSILHLEGHSWEQALKLGLTRFTRRELKYILHHFLLYHLAKKIKSARFL